MLNDIRANIPEIGLESTVGDRIIWIGNLPHFDSETVVIILNIDMTFTLGFLSDVIVILVKEKRYFLHKLSLKKITFTLKGGGKKYKYGDSYRRFIDQLQLFWDNYGNLLYRKITLDTIYSNRKEEGPKLFLDKILIFHLKREREKLKLKLKLKLKENNAKRKL